MTALALAVIVIGTLATGSSLLWAVLVSLFCVAAAWEFARLSAVAPRAQVILSCAFLAIIVAAFAAVLFGGIAQGEIVAVLRRSLLPFLIIAAVFWLAVVPFQLSRRLITLDSPLSVFIMPVVIGAAWLSAVVLHRAGFLFLIAVIVVTVVADVAAYFVGRRWGRVKLAPSISPGKTREGALGGIAAAAIWTAASATALGVCSGAVQIAMAAVAGAFLGVCAVMGDLWESQLKRQAGVKDSSQLLPGHGGVLDRIDAQLAVLPVATVLLMLVKPLW